jgi:hypothetical protein
MAERSDSSDKRAYEPWEAVAIELVDNLLKDNSLVAFHEPVDIECEGLEDYLEEIERPMDLSTLKENLEARAYDSM